MRPYIGATVLVSEHNPDPFYRGKRGEVWNIGERWGFVRVKFVIDDVTYKPLIQRGYLEVVTPESEASA